MATEVCGNNRLVYSLRGKHKYAKALCAKNAKFLDVTAGGTNG
jgi:hypothetical protein